jgi:hypothetical protein
MSQKIRWKVIEVKGARGEVINIDKNLRIIKFRSEKGMRTIPIDSLIEIIGETEDEKKIERGEKSG